MPTNETPVTANPIAKRKNGIPRGFRFAGSVADQITKLEIGETVSRAQRLAPHEGTKERIEKTYASLASSLSSGLYRVDRDLPGIRDQFKTERGQYFTTDGALMLVVTVSRVDK
jgi:hypothetical protein